MKKFLLFTTLFALLLGSGCNNSKEPVEIPIDPPAPPVTEAPFKIAVKDVTAVMATIEVEPLDTKAGYYMDVLSESDFREAERSGIDSYLQWMTAYLIEMQGVDLNEALKMMTSYGNDGFYLTSLKPASNYYAIAVGIDSFGFSTTEVVSVPFTTQAPPTSENIFDVTITGPEEGVFTIDVDVSNEDPYVLAIYPRSITADYSDEDVASFVIRNNMAWGAIEQITYTGDKLFHESGKSGWEYEVIAFGYAEGLATTPAQRVIFKIPDGGDPAACTFDMKLEFKDFNMNSTISPSDETVVYICDVMEESYYQTLLAELGSQEEALKANLEAMIESYIAEVGSRGQVVEMLTLMGPIRFSMRFRAKTEYRQWAVPVDANGKPTAPFTLGEKQMSPDEVQSDVSLALKSYTCYNGDDFYALDPVAYKGAKGFAVVELEVEPSPDAVEWWSYIALEDLTDRPRATIVNNLLIAPTEKNLTSQLIVCYWGTNTIMGVAKDAEGNYGPLLLEVVELSKETATPLHMDN